MKSSFADADSAQVPTAPTTDAIPPVAGNPAPDANAQLTTPGSTAVVADNFFSNDGVEGDFDARDIKMPRLSLVQGVGPLSGELGFTPGTFVYNKETVVGDEVKNPQGAVIGTDGLEITLVHLKKYFLEDLPYDGSGAGPIAQYFRSLDDARKAGFLPIQDKRQMGEDHKYVKPVLDADILIKGKPGMHVSFPFDFQGTPYAIARWTLQSTAYTRVGKQFFTDSQLALKNCGLLGKFYGVSSRKENLGANFVFVPKAQLKGVNTAEFIAWAKQLTSTDKSAS